VVQALVVEPNLGVQVEDLQHFIVLHQQVVVVVVLQK
jgi:hypothetical protein